jgi:hypothetical protein
VNYLVTASGQAFLDELGVRVPGHRPLIRYCVDWTEQRHHLSGAVGRGLLDRLSELGWIRRADHSRALTITEPGQAGLAQTFRIRLPSSSRSRDSSTPPVPGA